MAFDLLEPYAERVAIMGDGACLGPVARPLGQLATTMSHWEEAECHLERALRMAHRLGSPPIAAHIRADRARLLIERGNAGDREAAGDELRKAGETAARLGMQALRERLRALEVLTA